MGGSQNWYDKWTIKGCHVYPSPWVTPDDGINVGRELMGVFRGGSWDIISVGDITSTTGVVWGSTSQAWSGTDILMDPDNLLLPGIPLHIGW